MWISSSSIKNRVSNRGRIDIFSRGSISGWKASLLLLALASFSVVCAASDLPDWCRNKPDTCFAKNSDELEGGKRDDIVIKGDEITWDASKLPAIDLYSQECGKLSFNMSDLSGSDCKFSMDYHDCSVNIEWKKKEKELKFRLKEDDRGATCPDSELNVELNGANLVCKADGFDLNTQSFCNLKLPQKDGNGWCKFDFAFNKKTGSCNGKIQFGKDYKLLAKPPTTAAPETTPTTDATSIAANDPNNANAIDPINANTTPGADAAGLSPWIIAGIVVCVLILVAVVVGLLVFFLIRRRKRRGSPQNMVEKGNVENDPQCVSALSHTNTTQVAATNMKSGSEMVGEPSANEHKEDEERSKPASKVEVVKPMSQQKKKKDNTYQSLAVLQKEEAKNEPAPSPSPLPEENKPKRKLTPDELYEPLGDPMKAIPMHLSEKKISEKKISSKKQKKKVEEEAKNTPATPSPSRSSKKKKSEKKKKDDHYHRLSSLENEAKK